MTIERDGLFDISVTKILKEVLLEPETIFQCLLTIPGSHFQRREETMYFPGKGKLRSVKKETKLNQGFCLIKSSEIIFIFLTEFYMIL